MVMRVSNAFRVNPVRFVFGFLLTAITAIPVTHLFLGLFEILGGFINLIHSVGFLDTILLTFLFDPFTLFGNDKHALAHVHAQDVHLVWLLLFALGVILLFMWGIGFGLFLMGVIAYSDRNAFLGIFISCFSLTLIFYSIFNLRHLNHDRLSWRAEYNQVSRYRSAITEMRNNGVISEGEYRLRHAEALIHQDAITHCLGYPWGNTSRTYVSRLPYVIAADFEIFTEGPEALQRRLELICQADLAEQK